MDDETYENVTAFFEKENKRIATRISWLFATQTVIFGAFEYVNKHDQELARHFLGAIAQIGLWSSVCFGISIFAAAINYMYVYYPLTRDCPDKYPNLKGGLIQHLCIPIGFFASVALPAIFAVAWANFEYKIPE